MAVTEETEIPVEGLIDAAFTTMRDVAPDTKIVKQEYRIVNGKKIIYREMSTTIKGLSLRFFGYYTSDASGSTQYLVWMGEPLVDKYRADAEKFLNGLTSQ